MRFNFAVGIGFDSMNNPISQNDRVVKTRLSVRIVADKFGGCFITPGYGAWVNNGGEVISEPSMMIVADTSVGNVTDDKWREMAWEVAEHLRQLWSQSAVMVTELSAVTHTVFA